MSMMLSRSTKTVSTALLEVVFMISSKRLKMSALQNLKPLTRLLSVPHLAKELVLVEVMVQLMPSAEQEAILTRNQALLVLSKDQDLEKEFSNRHSVMNLEILNHNQSIII